MQRSPLIVIVLSVLFGVLAFPPLDIPEAAYLMLVPLALWALHAPPWKRFLICAFVSGWGTWLLLMFWLRHVTWFGMLALTALLGVYFTLWAAYARWVLPRARKAQAWQRVPLLLSVAALWVLVEWLRGWLFGGIPWLPLAASQWERPVMLQLLPWTGAHGLSFLLVFFSLALAGYLDFLCRNRSKHPWKPGGFNWRLTAEIYFAVIAVLAHLLLYMINVTRSVERETMFRVGIVQPDAVVMEQFSMPVVRDEVLKLGRLTHEVAKAEPSFILWPESALTLLPLEGNAEMLEWTSKLSSEVKLPILGGALADTETGWYNALYVINPRTGVETPFYAKRKLVPFGEYVPLDEVLPFIRQVVPYDGEFHEGTETTLLSVYGEGHRWRTGGLICYEDIFPNLARASVRDGADWLVVVTNNAWFGEEGGAYQHAAHSVLRAAETRRPLVRCGNAGWSGWIDALGHVRAVVTDEEDTIYTRTTAVLEVQRARAYAGEMTLYTRAGDWFIGLCALLTGLGVMLARGRPARESVSESRE